MFRQPEGRPCKLVSVLDKDSMLVLSNIFPFMNESLFTFAWQTDDGIYWQNDCTAASNCRLPIQQGIRLRNEPGRVYKICCM